MSAPASRHDQPSQAAALPDRLLSLDVMRGGIMVLLMLESTRLYTRLLELEGTPFHGLALQLHHHPWHGLRFWDLIQPGFMFIAGTALALSLTRQSDAGVPWTVSLRKALRRSWWLFFWGVLDYAVRPDGLSFELWDVLTQLSFTLLVAFLIFRWPLWWQIAFSLGLLVLTEALYRVPAVAGFDQPFVDQHNIGNFIDWVLMRKINPEGWVAINCLPTAAHTIWGAVAGKLLLSPKSSQREAPLARRHGSGRAGRRLRDGLDGDADHQAHRDHAPSCSPPAATCCSAWRPATGSIDVRKIRPLVTFFTVVGMNSLFIYLFFEIVGNRWFTDYMTDDHQRADDDGRRAARSRWASSRRWLVFTLEWRLCYFLYRKRIFFKV